MAKRKSKPAIRDTDIVYSCVAYDTSDKKTRKIDRVRWALHPELDSLAPCIRRNGLVVRAPLIPFRVVWDYLDYESFIDPSCRESEQVVKDACDDRSRYLSFNRDRSAWLEYLARGEPGRQP